MHDANGTNVGTVVASAIHIVVSDSTTDDEHSSRWVLNLWMVCRLAINASLMSVVKHTSERRTARRWRAHFTDFGRTTYVP